MEGTRTFRETRNKSFATQMVRFSFNHIKYDGFIVFALTYYVGNNSIMSDSPSNKIGIRRLFLICDKGVKEVPNRIRNGQSRRPIRMESPLRLHSSFHPQPPSQKPNLAIRKRIKRLLSSLP